jgi:2-polyprenyl-3-methyl-5-hydroxy-6-metoxy-1,4-benzoquinol methylase
MEEAPGHCILCGTSERELLIRQDPWNVKRCTHCGLGFLDPRPSKEDLRNLYGEEYFVKHYGMGAEPDTAKFKRKLRSFSSHIRFFRRIKRKGRILDVGCGNAYFLSACREKGYEVHGLDISGWAVQYATQKLGLPIALGAVDEVELPSQSFDIITMWHFLEHTRDPQLALQKVKSWLKRDGILVVEVPNYEGTDAQHMWQAWDGWSLPYHFWHFSVQTQERLLRKSGFRVVKSKTYHSAAVRGALKQIPGLKLFARLISRFYSGHSVAVISVLDENL